MDFPEREDVDRVLYLYSESHGNEAEVVDFWSRSVSAFGRCQRSAVLSVDDFVGMMEVSGIFPSSFTVAVSQLESKGVLLAESSLPSIVSVVGQTTSVASSGARPEEPTPRSSGFVSSILTSAWSISETVMTFVANATATVDLVPERSYVLIESLGEMERMVLRTADQADITDRILSTANVPGFPLSWKTFLRRCVENNGLLSDESRTMFLNIVEHESDIVLRYLLRQGKVSIADECICIGNATKLPHAWGVYSSMLKVKLALFRLEQRVESMNLKMQSHKQKAIAAKSAGNDSAALLQLKIRKMVEEEVKKLIGAQHSLEQSLLSMEGSLMNSDIIGAFKVASEGLRASRAETGVDVESVEDAIDSFEAEMDEMREINDALFAHSSLSHGEESELEEELKALMAVPPAVPVAPVDTLTATLPAAPTQLPKPQVTSAINNTHEDTIRSLERRLANL